MLVSGSWEGIRVEKNLLDKPKMLREVWRNVLADGLGVEVPTSAVLDAPGPRVGIVAQVDTAGRAKGRGTGTTSRNRKGIRIFFLERVDLVELT
jgi:hypothetical protein